MSSAPCILYFGTRRQGYDSVELAKSASETYMNTGVELRIEIVGAIKEGEPDYWAYEYESKSWMPS